MKSLQRNDWILAIHTGSWEDVWVLFSLSQLAWIFSRYEKNLGIHGISKVIEDILF